MERLGFTPTELAVALRVADAIGGDATPERIARVIKASNERSIAFHGFRILSSAERASYRGILPHTPEGGWVSYWTSGQRIFDNGEKYMASFDTTFFHYGHSSSENSNTISMRIAALSVDWLRKIHSSAEILKDGYMAFNFPIPRNVICMLEVDVPTDLSLSPRQNSQRGEQAMFSLIERATNGDFIPGGILRPSQIAAAA